MDTKPNKDAVAYNMKLIRSLTDQSMNEFGKRLGGLSKDQIASYETARALPQEATILRILEMTGLNRQEFLTQKITQELVVKEVFNTLNKGEEPIDRIIAEQQKVIEAQRQTINVQLRMIEMQKEMLETFLTIKPK